MAQKGPELKSSILGGLASNKNSISFILKSIEQNFFEVIPDTMYSNFVLGSIFEIENFFSDFSKRPFFRCLFSGGIRVPTRFHRKTREIVRVTQ